VVSRVIFDDGMLQAPPHPQPLSSKGARVARRGVFISRGETGEGVSPIVKSNMGHHTSGSYKFGIVIPGSLYLSAC
jgi:hypothetical protein